MGLADVLDMKSEPTDLVRELAEKVKEHNDVVIFGAGIGGAKTWEIMEVLGLGEKIKAFSDNNPAKIGRRYCGKPVIHSSAIFKLYPLALVVISSTAYNLTQTSHPKNTVETVRTTSSWCQ